MLAYRIIPQILCNGRKMIKGKRYCGTRSVGVVAQAVRIHQSRGVDELLLLDIGATPEGRSPDLLLISQLSAGCFAPMSVGGGVHNVDDVTALLRAGADKVVIGTSAFFRPNLLPDISERFGKQVVSVSVDVKGGCLVTHCGTEVHETLGDGAIEEYAQHIAQYAGEIILNSVDREGTMDGYDLGLIETVSKSVDIPVVASGGCSGYEDMYNAIQAGASAVSAGALFQFADATPQGAAEYLSGKGLEVRV